MMFYTEPQIYATERDKATISEQHTRGHHACDVHHVPVSDRLRSGAQDASHVYYKLFPTIHMTSINRISRNRLPVYFVPVHGSQ